MTSQNCWSLRSNDGWSIVSFEPQLIHEDGDIEFAVRLEGRFWYRKEEISVQSDVIDDFRIELPSVLIPISACKELMIQFENWMLDNSAFSCTLVSNSGQKLDLRIGEMVNFITTVDHPALSICYEAPRCRLEVFFVIDQSCIEQGRSQLKRILSEFEND